jgi:protein O-mannosyl-transferase
VLATLLFVLSLLTKPVTVTLPAALLVILWWQRGRLAWRRDVRPLVPWFVLSIVSGLFAAWVEHDVLGARGEGFSLSPAQRLLLPGHVFWFYLSKLVWPTELIFVYPRWAVDPAVWWQWLYPAGLIALMAGLVALARRSRAPLAALLFFIAALFPFLGFFNAYLFLYTYVADHFQYLASLGVIALVGGAAAAAIARVPGREARAALLLVLPAVLGVLTFRQSRMYADTQTLYETTIQKNPACWMAYNNLGIVLQHNGKLPAAMEQYRRALQLRPDYAEAHNNLGTVLNATGRFGEAITDFQEALRLRPDYPNAQGNLIAALAGAGRLPEAIAGARQAVERYPDEPGIRLNFGIALGMAGQHAEAVDQLAEAVRLRPDQSEAHKNLAIAYAEVGRLSDAAAAARRARDLARSPAQIAEIEKLEAWIESSRTQAGSAGGGP